MPLRRSGRGWAAVLLPLLFPPACAACTAGIDPDQELCPACAAGLGVRDGRLCARCGELAPDPGQPCHGCRARRPRLSWVRVPLAYVGTGGALVRALKFRRRTTAGACLVRHMARLLRQSGPPDLQAHVLVPVPVDPVRRQRRGFDQAEWLARTLGRRMRLPCRPGCLRRCRPTLPQGDVRVLSRARNVAGAFAVVRPGPLRGRKVLLVDDVSTSGATAAECARVLRQAGVASVALVAGCRGGLPVRPGTA